MEQKIVELIAEKLCKKTEQITLTARLVEDLGADSLDVVEVLMSIEDEFKVEIPDEEIENIRTIGELATYIENNQ